MTAEDNHPTPPKTCKPESLEAKFKLLQLLPYDARAKRKHCLVFGFILDWYHSKYGDALASVRHIVSTIKDRDPSGKGLYAGDVHRALTDLVAWGYLNQEKGIGRRASRYVPIWEKLSSVHKIPNTTENEISVRENTNTCVRENTNTTADSVRDSMNEDPVTGPGHKTRVRVSGNIDTLDAMSPAGLAPAEAGTRDPEGFNELYKAYGLRRKRDAAKSVYEKIAPDAHLRARMVEAAGLWRSSYEENNTDIKWRKYLHSWLAKECWEEDPPVAYVDAKEAAIAKAKDRGSNPARGAKPSACSVVKSGINDMYIVGVRQEGGPAFDEHRVTLGLEYADTGERITHELHVHDINGPVSGYSAWVDLNRVVDWSFNIADIKGYAVKVANGTNGTISFGKSFLPPKEEVVEVAIVRALASPVEPDSAEECVEIAMMTDDDITLEWFAMLKSNDVKEQADDQQRIASLLTAVGVTGVDDERDLIGKRLKIIKQGKKVKEFLPHPSLMQQAA